jgi:hypothetical protein
MSEAQIQELLVRMLRNVTPPLLFTTTGAGLQCGVACRVRMNRMGYTKGMPDLFIFEPRNGSHGLVIELKTNKGALRPDQRAILERFRGNGYTALAVYGLDEAMRVIGAYLNVSMSITEHATPPTDCAAQPVSEKPHL